MNRTITGVADAMQHFGVTAADLNRVLVAALEKGGDYADLYFEHSFNNSITLLDGHVNSCSANIDFPTFGLDTNRYTPLDFIRLFTMMSFFMLVSI